MLTQFADLLQKEAIPAGFIAPGDTERITDRHILDSLVPLRLPEIAESISGRSRIADLGSGAGLPGVPLAIMLPETEFLLVEASFNRCEFLRRTISRLQLPNVKVLETPAEQFSGKRADGVVFRAFRKPLASLELALFVSDPGARIYYYRVKLDLSGKKETDYSKRLHELGIRLARAQRLPDVASGVFEYERSQSPRKGFPRRWTKIQNDPIVNGII